MKRKQFLALLLSASVVGSTVMPAYAADVAGAVTTTTITMEETGETPDTEQVDADTEEAPVEEGVMPEAPNYTEGTTVEGEGDVTTTPQEDVAETPETDPADNVTTPVETPEAPAENGPSAGTTAPMSLNAPEPVAEKPLENGADFMADADNFVGHYKNNGDGTVDLVYVDTKLVDPEYDNVTYEDITSVTIPSTIQHDGQTYQVKNVSFRTEVSFVWEMETLTLSEGIQSAVIKDMKKLHTLTLPTTLTSFNNMDDQLADGTPAAYVDASIGTINFAGNSELVYDANIHKFYSTNRGSGVCDNVGDQFALKNFKYELVDAETVDVINVIDSEIEDNTDITVSNQVTFGEKTFTVRNVRVIGESSSKDTCPNMEYLTIEEGVQTVNFNADGFYKNLKAINIPASASIGSFSEFPALNSWNVDILNANYKSDLGILFNKDKSELIAFPATKAMDTYVVPAFVKTIKTEAFLHNKGINHLVVNSTVDTIEPMAIRTMNNVQTIVIDNVGSVKQNNVLECQNLETVTVRGVGSYPVGFVADNPNLKTINIEGNVTSMMGYTFTGNPSLEVYNVTGTTENQLHSIDGVLYYNKAMWSYPANKPGEMFVVPAHITKIGKSVFNNTKNLKSVVCPKGIEFDTGSVFFPENPINIYLSDLDAIHYVDGKIDGIFISEVGGTIFAPTQATLDSINATAGTALDGYTAAIGVIPVEIAEAVNDSLTINKGKSEKLDIKITPAYATEVLTYEVSSDFCSVSADGTVTANKVGTGTISIKGQNGTLATVDVTVRNPVQSMQFTSDKYEINKGETKKLGLTYKPEDADITGMKWSSDNEKVVKVSKTGEAVAIGAGTATVTATCDGVTATCKVTVKVPLESITMSETKKTINKGKSFDLDITMNPTDATVSSDVEWSSADTKIATVDKNGKVTAVGAGTVTITADLEGKTATCKVTVEVPLESITMSETKKTVNKGESFDLDITKNPTDTTVKGDVKWSSDDTDVAVVDQNGKVTAKGAGTTVITASLDGKETTCKVTVKIPLESISMSETKKTINKGKSFDLDITMNPTDATVSSDVEWSSDDNNIATVDKNGKVTAVGAGTVTITADLEEKTATCKVTVKVPLESIAMSETQKTVNKGDSFDLDITKNPTDTTVKDDVKWSSNDTDVAVVDQNGKVTAKAAGTAVITANLDGKETTCKVTVKVPLESITMSETKKTVNKGDAFNLDVTMNPTDATVSSDVEWSSADTKIATVDKNGKVTAVGAGTVTITADLEDKTAICKVTVKVPLENISMSETKKTVNKGEAFKLDVTMNPTDATVSSDVKWSSDDNNIATVDKNGRVIAVGAGTATITADLEGKTATCKVTVKVPLESIDLTRDTASIVEGGTLDLDVLYKPTDTTVTKDVNWSSDKESVASVDKNGKVTAKAEGTATITAEVDGKKATCKITVTKKPIALDSIELSMTKLSMDEGEEKQITVKFNPSNATVDKKVNWSTSNASVAVVDATGKVTAKGAGTANITAEVAGKTATCQVTVKKKEIALDSIKLSETKLSMVQGDSKKLDVTFNPTNTTVDKTVAWSSDNKDVATVDQNGNITAKGVGTATITAKVAGKTATCTVTVSKKEIALDSIQLSDTKVTLEEGGTKQLSLTFNPSNTTVDKTVAWTSDNAYVAIVSADGKITAVAPGTANITATVDGKTATCQVTVTAKESENGGDNEVALDSIQITEKEVLLDQGGTKQLEVKYNPTNTTVDKTVAWSSDNTDVATVDKNGKVTAKDAGTAFITADVNGKKAVCKVTVKAKSVVVDPEEDNKNDGTVNGQTDKNEKPDAGKDNTDKGTENGDTPKTGDPTGMNLLLGMLSASAAGIGSVLFRIRRKDDTEE